MLVLSSTNTFLLESLAEGFGPLDENKLFELKLLKSEQDCGGSHSRPPREICRLGIRTECVFALQ